MEIDDYFSTLDKLQEATKILCDQDIKYKLSSLIECYRYLMDKYCPFKIGDRVMLKETPTINIKDSPGWMESKHFLIKGSPGTIRSTECDGIEGFYFDVMFDNETWIDLSGKEQPVTEKSVYGFGERWLELFDKNTISTNDYILGDADHTLNDTRGLERTYSAKNEKRIKEEFFWVPEAPNLSGVYANLLDYGNSGKISFMQPSTWDITKARQFKTREECEQWCNNNRKPVFIPVEHGIVSYHE